MEFLKSGEIYVVRIDKGEEVMQKLEEFGALAKLPSFSFTGIGAADKITVSVYDLEKKTYEKREFRGQMEIDSLIGSVTRDNGKPHTHIHITFSGEDMAVYGGHLNECVISGTCEITALPFECEIERKKDELTGLRVFDLSEK